MHNLSVSLQKDISYSQETINDLRQRCADLTRENERLIEENHRINSGQKQMMVELSRLYEDISGDHNNKPKWSIRDYALAIYTYLDNIIALAPGNIFWFDNNNVIKGGNNENAECFGCYARQAMVGKTSKDLFTPEQAEILEKNNLKVIQSNKPLIIEESLETTKGSRVFLSYKVPLRNQMGEVIGLLGTALDITEQKKIQKELKKAKESLELLNLEREEYINEVQQKLLPQLRLLISGSAELLKEEKDNRNRLKLEALNEAAEKLQKFFNDIIYYGKE